MMNTSKILANAFSNQKFIRLPDAIYEAILLKAELGKTKNGIDKIDWTYEITTNNRSHEITATTLLGEKTAWMAIKNLGTLGYLLDKFSIDEEADDLYYLNKVLNGIENIKVSIDLTYRTSIGANGNEYTNPDVKLLKRIEPLNEFDTIGEAREAAAEPPIVPFESNILPSEEPPINFSETP